MVLEAVREVMTSGIAEAKRETWAGEAVAFCPRCKAFQTVWFNGRTLMPTRKFIQRGDQVYHDCGSTQPCRLYRSY